MCNFKGVSKNEDYQQTWPVLIVSGQFEAATDDGFRLRKLEEELLGEQECSVQPSYSYEDAIEIFMSRADFGAVVIDWDIQDEQIQDKLAPEKLLNSIRRRNKNIPVFLLTDRLAMENIPTSVLSQINEFLWKTADTVEFVAGRIETHLVEYIRSVYPVFLERWSNTLKHINMHGIPRDIWGERAF